MYFMRQLFYRLNFALAIVLITNSARLSAAVRPGPIPNFENSEAPWVEDENVQLQLNGKLKTGLAGTNAQFEIDLKALGFEQVIFWQITEDENGKKDHDATAPVNEGKKGKKKASSKTKRDWLKRFSFFKRRDSKKNVRRGESAAPLQQETWQGLPLHFLDPRETDENVMDLCGTQRSLLIGTDGMRLKGLRQKQAKKVRLYSKEFQKSHGCIIALSDGGYPDPILRSFPILTGVELMGLVFRTHLHASVPTFSLTKGEARQTSAEVLHQLLVERGVKAFVFVEGSLGAALTTDFQDFAKLVNEGDLLLYIIIAQDSPIKNLFSEKGIKVEEFIVADPSNVEFLINIKAGKNLWGEEIVLFDNEIENTKRASLAGFMPIQVAGGTGFEFVSLKAVSPQLERVGKRPPLLRKSQSDQNVHVPIPMGLQRSPSSFSLRQHSKTMPNQEENRSPSPVYWSSKDSLDDRSASILSETDSLSGSKTNLYASEESSTRSEAASLFGSWTDLTTGASVKPQTPVKQLSPVAAIVPKSEPETKPKLNFMVRRQGISESLPPPDLERLELPAIIEEKVSQPLPKKTPLAATGSLSGSKPDLDSSYKLFNPSEAASLFGPGRDLTTGASVKPQTTVKRLSPEIAIGPKPNFMARRQGISESLPPPQRPLTSAVITKPKSGQLRTELPPVIEEAPEPQLPSDLQRQGLPPPASVEKKVSQQLPERKRLSPEIAIAPKVKPEAKQTPHIPARPHVTSALLLPSKKPWPPVAEKGDETKKPLLPKPLKVVWPPATVNGDAPRPQSKGKLLELDSPPGKLRYSLNPHGSSFDV